MGRDEKNEIGSLETYTGLWRVNDNCLIFYTWVSIPLFQHDGDRG